ncbi:RidA family protein [Sphingomonas flavalba]|uniref:RidA family protein n=1 Tax=Sphingomonas flavalba TaxID=2559804 RepID=UPI00109D99A6|nr:RidA family protein [Sphingomonas flavalba]
MTRELIDPPSLHPAPGFSHIAIASGTKLVMFAGQTALDPNFDLIGEDDLHAQTVAAMRNLETAMQVAGVSWDHIIKRTIFTRFPGEFQLITNAIDEVTGGAAHPPQTLVGVSGLALPGLLIEIEAIALLP